MPNKFGFRGKVWLYPGEVAWHFMSVPKEISEEIKDVFGEMRRGWGSLPVEVKIGQTKWKTSIFPDSKTKLYLLPVKAQVRNLERLEAGDSVVVHLQIIT